LLLSNLGQALATRNELVLDNVTQKLKIKLRHRMPPRQVQLVLKGGLINWTRQRLPG
jgi:aconitate hydratase